MTFYDLQLDPIDSKSSLQNIVVLWQTEDIIKGIEVMNVVMKAVHSILMNRKTWDTLQLHKIHKLFINFCKFN